MQYSHSQKQAITKLAEKSLLKVISKADEDLGYSETFN